MNVLIDTNVVLDILLKREPFHQSAARVNVLSEKGLITGYMSASAVTDVYYIAQKETKRKDTAMELLRNLLKTVRVAAVTEGSVKEALDLNWNDFEDAVQYVAGKGISADYVITRNPSDFAGSEIEIITPDAFVDLLTSEE